MKLFYPHRILDVTRSGDQLPRGFIGVGIHPSSLVDQVDIDNVRLGPKSIVPLNPTQTANVQRVRWPIVDDATIGTPGAGDAPGDGDALFGQKLVLQCYEPCDALVPPGPRTPYYRDISIAAASLGTTGAAANIALTIPFWGRTTMCLSVMRTSLAQDLSFFVVGRKHGNRSESRIVTALPSFADQDGVWTESGVFAWGIPTNTLDPTVPRWRTVYFGGLGDAAECYDYLQVYCYGPAGGGDVLAVAEAYGEAVG